MQRLDYVSFDGRVRRGTERLCRFGGGRLLLLWGIYARYGRSGLDLLMRGICLIWRL